MTYLMFPESYYKKELNIKLTEAEIDMIIEELERTEHNLYTFLNYEKLIKKLKRERCQKKPTRKVVR